MENKLKRIWRWIGYHGLYQLDWFLQDNFDIHFGYQFNKLIGRAGEKEVKNDRLICPLCGYWLTPAEATAGHCPACNKRVQPKRDGYYYIRKA